MSSNIIRAIRDYRKNLHNVGSLNNWGKKILNQGAIVTEENMDNYQIAELGFSATGERICKPLTDTNTKGVLVASVEDYMKEYETIGSFFNAIGERARIVYLEKGRRFECSNFETVEQDLNAHPIKNGQVVHYDHTSKKFKISNGAINDPAYALAGNKFVVVDKEPVSIDGIPVIRFEVVE